MRKPKRDVSKILKSRRSKVHAPPTKIISDKRKESAKKACRIQDKLMEKSDCNPSEI